MNTFIRTSLVTLSVAVVSLSSINVSAQLMATFEINDAVLPAYTTTATEVTPFTTITFDGVFAAPPNVFIMTPQFGTDPCLIRINNVTTTGFDATCLEPFSEDRNSPDTSFSYLAIEDGGVTVPIVGGGSTVLESNCSDISTQQFGGGNQNLSCPGCDSLESFTPISFSTAFTNPPALLTQVQTINNFNTRPFTSGGVTTSPPAGEPAFIDAAVGDNTSDVTASGFDLAIERFEAGSGTIVSENICYLAAEINGCQSLDFSSLGGPTTPVAFQALNGLQNVEGQNTTGSTTNFANACFDSTPTALAKHITQNGGDGGFLRLASINSTGITLIIDEDTVRDTERNHGGDEQPSIFAFGETLTTPVTLNSAKISTLGLNATFNWETSAETFHLGFNLWGETAEGWVQLNNQFIKGNASDTDKTQSYRRTIQLSSSQIEEITNFGVSSVDSSGYEEFYGPFSEGEEYGEEANNEPIDWTDTRDTFERSMRKLGFVNINNSWRQLSDSNQAFIKRRFLGVNRSMFDINVNASGIHSINAAELIELNPSWNSIQLNRIALTVNGDAVPRHIVSTNNTLDPNDRIVFNASVASGDDTPFIEHYTYRLSIEATKSRDANVFDGTYVDEPILSNDAFISEKLTTKKLHSAALTNGDPWYDARLLSVGSPVSVSYNSDFNFPINNEKDSQLDLVLFGGLDLPDEQDDHHIQVTVNDSIVLDTLFDGLIEYREKITLPAGLLKTTNNIVSVTVVGDTGLFADVVLVDEVSLSAFSALSNKPAFDFAHNIDSEGYQIKSNNELEVYAYTNNGLLSSVITENIDDNINFSSLPFQANTSNDTQLRYAAAQASAWPAPSSINVVFGKDLHTEETDYLIVAHPSFIGDDLNDFVNFKTELGYTVRVVDWLEVVNTYGYGNNTPSALDNLLKAANELYSTENVLIVGGHTFDYFGITNDSIINFIPGHYRPVSVFEYTATDNPYADLNDDNIPEIAIGRWPVRSVVDLKNIIAKTKDWHRNRDDSPFQDAFLLAQATDGQDLDFGEQLDIRVDLPLSQLDEINLVNRLYLDSLPVDITDAVAFTRAQLAEKINDGVELVSFSGHGSPTSWGFQNIINTDFIQGLENQGEPILLMPLACFITHYESVSTNTLAHQWLFAGEQGAAAIHGASVLGAYRENGLFAERYLRKSKTSNTLGKAILEAKKELGSNNEILHNWSLLGDPALPIR